MSNRRWIVAVAALTAAASGIAPAAAQAPMIKIPRVKEKVAKLSIDVAGFVTTEQLKDTTSDCYPGRSYH